MATTEAIPIIDVWGMPNPREVGQAWMNDPFFQHSMRHVFKRPEIFEGWSMESMIAEMDRNNIKKVILSAVVEHKTFISNELIADCVQKWPDRFIGACCLNPREGLKAVKEFQMWVKEYGFRNIKLLPYSYELPPSDRIWYPLYTKAAELDIPVTVQVGHTGPLFPSWVGRPMYLDQVALMFPELVLIGAHIGWPWTNEMIALAFKFPNVYIETSAWSPKRFDKDFFHFANSWGQDKCMAASDYPMFGYDRWAGECQELVMKPAAKRKFLYENAAKVFKITL